MIAASSISFGTSGLRGPAGEFTPQIIAAYVGAFLDRACEGGRKTVLIGTDLRASSPEIARSCAAAAARSGFDTVYGGNIPTPALAAYGLTRKLPCIMVTGSHIPETFNGLKFYRREGEFLKEDEEPVRTEATRRMSRALNVIPAALPDPLARIAAAYVARYTDIWKKGILSGLRIGIDLHAAAGRDLLVEIVSSLGAQCFPFHRTDQFVAVDTEALDADDIARARDQIAVHRLDAVISTDGDGDRPLVIDENGQQINGDVLGALTARFLGITSVVTPLTSTSAIEQSDWFSEVVRTRVGSPYVVSAMREVSTMGQSVAGFEANGGFLLQTPVKIDGRELAALPTRDAVLPILASLIAAKRHGSTLSSLAASLPSRSMRADRLKSVAHDVGRAFLSSIQASRAFRAAIHPALDKPRDINTIDGVRLILETNEIVHFRQSGNAPELRCYVEADDGHRADRLLQAVMAGMSREIRNEGAAQ